jgi:hypothetical protein
MKRFVVAGIFFVLGFIILGVATSYVMSGPDKPTQPSHPASANADETNKRHGSPGTMQQVNTQPLQSQDKSGQFGMPGGMGGTPSAMGGASGKSPGSMGGLTQVPGTIVPLTTAVPPPTIRPNLNNGDTPHVPVLQQTDESSSRGTQQGTAK